MIDMAGYADEHNNTVIKLNTRVSCKKRNFHWTDWEGEGDW